MLCFPWCHCQADIRHLTEASTRIAALQRQNRALRIILKEKNAALGLAQGTAPVANG